MSLTMLEDLNRNAGVHGNGHMMMLEKNNLEIAALPKGWIEKNAR